MSIRADLGGVAVLTPLIELAGEGVEIRLRAVTLEDFEEAQPAELRRLVELRLHRPTSAILEVDYHAPDASGWQRELSRVVAVLQLFGVGDVGYSLVQFGSESLVELGNAVIAVGDGSTQPRTYAIRDGDLERLQRFWDHMSRTIPEHLYWNQPDDRRGLAATHFWYRRALGRGGWVNEQTAEVVRALESLLIKGKAKGVISATLRKRASTLLGACGLDAKEVDVTLGLAYDIRSRYVHGEELAKRDERRIQKQAGDIITVFRRCLDYLRLALVAAIAAGIDKDALIAAIDAASRGNVGELQRIGHAFRMALP